METKIRLKIKEIVDESGQTPHSLSDNPAQNRRLNRQINEGYALTIPTLLDILDKFPTVSSEWLLRGEGNKYKTDVPRDGDTEEIEDLRIELTKVHAERDELLQVVEDLKRQAKEWRESDEYKQTFAELRAEAAELRARLDEQRTNFRVLAESMGRPTKPTPLFDTSTGAIQIIGANASPRVANAAKRAAIRSAVAEAKSARAKKDTNL
jgi:hypothetical protein